MRRGGRKGVEQLGVPRSRLTLTSATEVAAQGDRQSDQDHGEDGGQASGKAGPVQIDEADAIIRLVEGDVIGGIVTLVSMET